MTNSKGRQQRQPVSVTGRDAYLVLQAFAYAILTIEALPEVQQEWSNKEDMKTLLHAWSRGHSRDFLTCARRHIEGTHSELSGCWSENVVELAHNTSISRRPKMGGGLFVRRNT